MKHAMVHFIKAFFVKNEKVHLLTSSGCNFSHRARGKKSCLAVCSVTCPSLQLENCWLRTFSKNTDDPVSFSQVESGLSLGGLRQLQEGLLAGNIERGKSKIHNKIDVSAELSFQTKTECHQFQRGLSGDLPSMQDSVISKQLQALKVRYQQDRKKYEKQTFCIH